MPSDSRAWQEILLRELLSNDRGISVGVMYPGSHDPGGVPLIKAGDLAGNRINPRPGFRISRAVHDEYRRTELQGGELLMTLVGDVGRCAIVSPEMRGWNAARAIAVMRFKSPEEAAYVRICLSSRHVRHLIDAWSNTTVQQTLNLKELKQIPLPWPALRVRQAIARTLGALDDKIALDRRTNETLEAMARVVFQSWFVDFEADAELIETEHGPMPKGWSTSTLREHVTLQRGTTYSGDLVGLPGPALLRLGSIEPGGGFRDGHYKTYGGECPQS